MLNALRAGGSQTYTIELVRRLLEADFGALIVAKAGPMEEPLRALGAEVYRTRWREGEATSLTAPAWRTAGASVITVPSLAALARTLRACRPVAVIASQPWPLLYGKVLRRALPEAKFLALAHGFTPVEIPPPGGRRTLAAYDAVFTSTTEARDHLRRSFEIEATVLGNLFDAETYWAGYRLPRPPLATARHLLSLSTLTENKSPAVELAIRWLASQEDWSLTVVGDGPHRSRLELLATDLGVRSRVTFAGSLVDPRPAIASATVVVAVGRAALESASLGVPTIIAGATGVAGPLDADNIIAFELFNFTDRHSDRRPLTPLAMAQAMATATSLESSQLTSLADYLRRVGSIDPLLQVIRGSGK